MAKVIRLVTAVSIVLWLFLPGPGRTYADDDLEETRRLLEKGLTLHELEREIGKLSEMEQRIARQISETQAGMEQKNRLVQERRQHAKKVLNAYYTGDRAPLWMMVLSARTWKDALYVLDQMQMIAQSDRRTLDRYLAAYREMKALNQKLEETKAELGRVKAKFEAQKKQQLQLQEEMNLRLAALPQKEQIARQMNELNTQWETKGLPLFKQYFSTLSETMQKLPELVAQNPQVLTMKGWNYTFQIKDSELNEFIRAKNKDLSNLSFAFLDGQIRASGKQGDTELTLTGVYELEEKPKNAIRFRVRDLTYNGFKLPAGTIQALESDYDLSFYPSQIASFLRATAVKTSAGKLTVDLKMSF